MSAETATVERPAPARFQLRVVAAIIHREWLVFRRVWFSMAFGSIVEPVLYFVAFGYGFGALVAEVAGLDYRSFIATGAIGIGILFSSAFPALIHGYFRRKEQQLYDAITAAPVSIAELVTGEAVWNALRVTLVAFATLAVAFAFGVRPGPGVLLVPVLSILGGFGFACAGTAFAARMRSTHSFDFVIVGVLVPMFVIAGTFFPLDGLPAWMTALGVINPLTHVVELLRFVTFGTTSPSAAAGHLAFVVGFDVAVWVVAVRLLRGALID